MICTLIAQNLFSDAQAVTTTAASTNLIDLGVDGNLGIGEPMSVVVVVDVALDDGNADETYVITVETDSDSGFATALATIATYTATRGDVAGSKYVLGIPADTSCKRYVRVKYTHGGTSPTGTYTSFLTATKNVQNDVSYANGYTIS